MAIYLSSAPTSLMVLVLGSTLGRFHTTHTPAYFGWVLPFLTVPGVSGFAAALPFTPRTMVFYATPLSLSVGHSGSTHSHGYSPPLFLVDSAGLRHLSLFLTSEQCLDSCH